MVKDAAWIPPGYHLCNAVFLTRKKNLGYYLNYSISRMGEAICLPTLASCTIHMGFLLVLHKASPDQLTVVSASSTIWNQLFKSSLQREPSYKTDLKAF